MRKIIVTTMLVVFTLQLAAKKKQPNIIWIFSDDHSYQTIGAYGGPLQSLNPTPNLDQLAKQGMRFDKCYVENSICAPSRGTLLTGKMSHIHGKITNTKKHVFDHNQQQFQKILQKNGYQTAMIGKIHLDGAMQGFHYWEVLPGQGKYYNPEFITKEGKTQYKDHYVSEVITERAINWLDNGRDKDKPFMLMVHHKAPHRNWDPAKQHMNKYEDIDIPEPKNLFDDFATRTVGSSDSELEIIKEMKLDRDLKASGKMYANDARYNKRFDLFKNNPPKGVALEKWMYQTYMKDYLRCIWSVDESIGEVMKWIKENGLEQNTVIAYSSDQGFFMGEHGYFDKRLMYEEVFRTPLIVKWPGTVKAGSVNKELVQNIDFAETFLDIAGAKIPNDMQGKSIVPLLKGKTPRNWRKSLYYHYYEYPGAHKVRKHEGVTTKKFKLIRFYGQDVPNGETFEMYDLKNDPSEMNNIYGKAQSAKKQAELIKELAKKRTQYEVTE